MEDFIYWTFETRHSDGFTYRFAVHEHEDGAMPDHPYQPLRRNRVPLGFQIGRARRLADYPRQTDRLPSGRHRARACPGRGRTPHAGRRPKGPP